MTYKTYRDKLKAAQALANEREDELNQMAGEIARLRDRVNQLISDVDAKQEYAEQLVRALLDGVIGQRVAVRKLERLLLAEAATKFAEGILCERKRIGEGVEEIARKHADFMVTTDET